MSQSTAAGKPRGPYAKSAEIKEAILDAAVVVFSRNGFRNGSIREIAEIVGRSETGVLHHVGSKDALMLEVLRRRDEWQENRDLEHGSTAHFAVREWIRIARSNMGEAGAAALYTVLSAEATSPEHPAHEFFVARYAKNRRYMRRTFEELRDEGMLLTDVPAESLAHAALAIMSGLQLQWLLEPDAVDMGHEMRVFLEQHVHPSVLAEPHDEPDTAPGTR